MTLDIKIITVFAIAFAALFVLAEVLFHVFSVRVEYTRKLVHLGSGLISLLFPLYLNTPLEVLVLCGSFTGILLMSLRLKLLPSINAVERKTRGSVLFPLVVVGCYMAFWWSQNYLFFFLPMMILAVSDPLAALVGKRLKIGAFSIGGNHKTIVGTITFLISAFALCFFSFYLFSDCPTCPIHLALCLNIAVSTALAECISNNGYDNLSIPLTTILLLTIFV